MLSWELRNGKPVYYRVYRLHGQLKKIYLGSGHQARQAAAEDAKRRERRQQELTERQYIAALHEETQTLYNNMRTLSRAAFLAAGFRQHHRGEWRKQRRKAITQHEGETTMVPQIQENVSIEELESILQRAMAGDENSLPAIRSLLDKAPAIWQDLFSITKRIESAWIQTIAKQDLITREALERQVADLKRTLQTEFSSPLESLVIESICTCFLAYKHAELAAAQQLQRNNGMGLTQMQQNHLTACQKRYLLAVKELARIRQLLTPRNTTVLNIANQQQVNLT
jgi:hypothetical protein